MVSTVTGDSDGKKKRGVLAVSLAFLYRFKTLPALERSTQRKTPACLTD